MSTYPSWQAGQRITAALLNAGLAQSVIKPGDQSVTSSTTLQNDNALVIPSSALVLNAQYLFTCNLIYEGGTLGSSDLKISWSVPAGATLRLSLKAQNASGNPNNNDLIQGANGTCGSGGAGNVLAALMAGSLIMGGTAGAVQLQWAQNTSSATATIVHAQSTLSLTRVS